MKIHCLYDQLMQVGALIPHPKNANKHPDSQIQRLAKILEYQGWRYPVKVSKRSGFVTSGHGRIAAAKLNGWTTVPVSLQDYESEEQETADIYADNTISSWAELDFSMLHNEVTNLGSEFDIELLGIKDFHLDFVGETVVDPKAEWKGMPEFEQQDLEPMRQIIVSFKTAEDVEAFSKLVDHPLTDITKSIWYPRVEPEAAMDKRY